MTEYLFTEQMRARSQDICPECAQDFNTTEIVHICPVELGTTQPGARWLMQQRRGFLVGTGRMDGVTSLAEAQMLMALPLRARVVLITQTNNKLLWRDRICKWRPQLVPMWFQTARIARPDRNQIVIVGYEALPKLVAIHNALDGTVPSWSDQDVAKVFSVQESEDVPILIIADVVRRLGNASSESWKIFRSFAEVVLGVRGRVWGVLSTSDGLSHSQIVSITRAFGLEEATEDLFFVNPGGLVQHPKRGGFRFGFDKKWLEARDKERET